MCMGVGWQPTAVNGNNAGSQQQGQGQLAACYGCRQPTAVNGNNAGSQQQGQPNLRHVMGVGWQPTAVNGNNAGSQQQGAGSQQQARANLRHVMGVGWQPTAVNGNNAGSQQQGQGQLEACYGCRLATYRSERQQCRVTTAGPGPTGMLCRANLGVGMLWV